MTQRPIMIGIVGDSAAGKTTLTRGIAQLLGPDDVTVICTDDYHRYDRQQRARLGITPLHPECNFLDIMQQHLNLLRTGQPILKPVYDHKTGTFDAPVYVKPKRFVVVEGLLGYSTLGCRGAFDVKVYLAPAEELRHKWKVKRDTMKRGYTEEQVILDMQRREPDSEAYIRPQRRWADVVVSFYAPPDNPNQDTQLNVRLVLRPTLPHPDLLPLIETSADTGSSSVRLGLDRDMGKPVDVLEIDGHATEERVRRVEELICEDMPGMRHVCGREPNLEVGKLVTTTGEALQSFPLALTQLFLVYHALKAVQTYSLS